MADPTDPPPESLLPYEAWTEEALRHVVLRALQHAASQGLPGGHHFYITFRTDDPGVVIPPRLKQQYPAEMTIVLQHQFWDLVVDEAAGVMSVGLSFGGVPSILRIPLAAITGFADPYVRHGMRFGATPDAEAEAEDDAAGSEPATPDEAPADEPQVVSLDAFRRRPPPRKIEAPA